MSQSIGFSVVTLDACLKGEVPFLPSLRSDRYEIIFVTEGCLNRTFDLNPIRINRYDLHILLEGQIGSLEGCSPDISGYYCRFGSDFLKENAYLNNDIEKELAFINSFMYRYPLRLSRPVYERLKNTFSILPELCRQPEKHKQLLYVYLVTIIYEIRQLVGEIDPDYYPSKSLLIAKRYSDLLAEHTGIRDLDFYAGQLGISPNHLNKSVRMAMGKTAIVLRNETTLLEAKMLLRQTLKPVGEIAFELGFAEPSYFSRFFKKMTGCTPMVYRNLEK